MTGSCDHDHNKKPVHGGVMPPIIPMSMATTTIMLTTTTMLTVMRA